MIYFYVGVLISLFLDFPFGAIGQFWKFSERDERHGRVGFELDLNIDKWEKHVLWFFRYTVGICCN